MSRVATSPAPAAAAATVVARHFIRTDRGGHGGSGASAKHAKCARLHRNCSAAPVPTTATRNAVTVNPHGRGRIPARGPIDGASAPARTVITSTVGNENFSRVHRRRGRPPGAGSPRRRPSTRAHHPRAAADPAPTTFTGGGRTINLYS